MRFDTDENILVSIPTLPDLIVRATLYGVMSSTIRKVLLGSFQLKVSSTDIA